jgi:hypothetical protein
MKFALEVDANSEKFLLEYQSNEFLGKGFIKVDHQEIQRWQSLFTASKVQSYDFVLGQREPVNVRIERESKFLFGEKGRVFVNDRLVRSFGTS